MSVISDLNGTFNADPTHSRIGFSVRHMMVSKVRGEFKEYDVNATFAPTSQPQIEVSIKADSVDTGNNDRDAHLKTNDFFLADEFNTIRFVATDVQEKGEDEVAITGDLTIRDVTKPVTVDMEVGGKLIDPYGLERIGLEGKATISRADFNVNFSAALETGGVVVSDKVTLEIELALVKPAA